MALATSRVLTIAPTSNPASRLPLSEDFVRLEECGGLAISRAALTSRLLWPNAATAKGSPLRNDWDGAGRCI